MTPTEPTTPQALGPIAQIFALIGALVAGGGGLKIAQRIQRWNGRGVGLADVVSAIKEEGADTRRVTHESSTALTAEIGKLASSIARLSGYIEGHTKRGGE